MDVQQTITFGLVLGFFKQAADVEEPSVETAPLGDELFHAIGDKAAIHDIYQRAFTSFEPYQYLLRVLASDPTIEAITQSDVIQQIDLGLGTDRAHKTQQKGANTFLHTLAAAGVGEYKRGNRSSETRLEITSQEQLESLLSLSQEETTSPEASADAATDAEPTNTDPTQSHSPESRQHGSPTHQTVSSTTEQLAVDVELAVSTDDDPAAVQELLQAIRTGWEAGAMSMDIHTGSDTDSSPDETNTQSDTEQERENDEEDDDASLADFS